MPRARQIKYGFFLNEKLAELPPLCRIFFQGLWLLADREGKLEDRPVKLKAQILPYDDADGDAFICALEDAQFVRRYCVDGARYIKILNFCAHQTPHKNESESVIPDEIAQEPEKHGASTIQEPEKHDENPSCYLLPDTNTKKEKKYKKKEKRQQRDAFDKFYARYPRRRDRERAWRAWQKIDPDESLQEKIMLAVENLLKEIKLKNKEKEFVKHPATWLNGYCWEDEPELTVLKQPNNESIPWAGGI